MKEYSERNLKRIVYTTIAIISAGFIIAANVSLWFFILKHLK